VKKEKCVEGEARLGEVRCFFALNLPSESAGK
jgi:hypothetical protein